ncbi:MAG: cbb3-type cytochrome c oxidase subunit I, partial [Terriglobales bacterium]
MTDEAVPYTAINSLSDIPEYRGLWSWVSSIDHKQIGIMYIVSALCFFLVGLTLALIMRTQLLVPMNHFVSQDLYNQIFTMHG